MPFYEYQCKNCGHELEAMQKISDPPIKKCSQCGKSQLQRLMSAPVFRLKGAGWYETDFKGDKDNQRNLADRPDADASKEESAKTDATADAKPGEKPDAKAADSKGKEAGSGDGKASDGGSSPGTKTTEKPAEKTVNSKPARPAASGAKRTASKRASRPVKKSAKKAKRSR